MIRDLLYRGTYRICPDDLTGAALSPSSSCDYYYVSGGTTITSIDTLLVGMQIVLDFKTATTLTHSSSLILPHDTDISTSVGDTYRFVELSPGVWKNISGGGSSAGGSISDIPYGPSWNGVTLIAPSKNAVYDEMETRAESGANTDIDSLKGMTNSIGIGSTDTNDDGTFNIAIGNSALSDTHHLSENNIAIGLLAGASTSEDTESKNNIFIGKLAGFLGTDALYNNCMYLGDSTVPSGSTPDHEIVIGSGITGNGDNTVTIGNSSNTDNYLQGKLNLGNAIAIGDSGTHYSVGDVNIAIGSDALQNAYSGSEYNISIGNAALYNMTTGADNNIAIGNFAGSSLANDSSSDNSIFIGKYAGVLSSTDMVYNKCMYIGDYTVPSGSDPNNEIVIGDVAVGNGDNTVTLGNNSITDTYFKGIVNIEDTGQIKFPATRNASSNVNTLDDYEEGTFTPTLAFSTTSAGLTYASQYGYYVKIGSLVSFALNIALSDLGTSAGYVQINGLPFTAANNSMHIPSAVYYQQLVQAGHPLNYISFNTASIPMGYQVSGGNSVLYTAADFNDETKIRMQGSYYTS